MSPIRVISILVALLVFLLSGCGEKESAPAAAPSDASVPAASLPDACSLVSEQDASALFGQSAQADSGPTGAAMVSQCLWSWDSDTSGQLLQFQVWDPMAYSEPEDSAPIDLGEGGYIRKHPMAGVDVVWRQRGFMISLSFSTVGPDAPDATDRADAVLELARRVSGRL